MSDIRIRAEHLEPFIQSVFENAGLPPEDAAIEAEVLIWANLRGALISICPRGCKELETICQKL